MSVLLKRQELDVDKSLYSAADAPPVYDSQLTDAIKVVSYP